uniref:Uncharacterized protein n=1 Tax=Rhizophora mucronata TaxID=61149 RepID=A0A2P2ILF1_RHIMU
MGSPTRPYCSHPLYYCIILASLSSQSLLMLLSHSHLHTAAPFLHQHKPHYLPPVPCSHSHTHRKNFGSCCFGYQGNYSSAHQERLGLQQNCECC